MWRTLGGVRAGRKAKESKLRISQAAKRIAGPYLALWLKRCWRLGDAFDDHPSRYLYRNTDQLKNLPHRGRMEGEATRKMFDLCDADMLLRCGAGHRPTIPSDHSVSFARRSSSRFPEPSLAPVRRAVRTALASAYRGQFSPTEHNSLPPLETKLSNEFFHSRRSNPRTLQELFNGDLPAGHLGKFPRVPGPTSGVALGRRKRASAKRELRASQRELHK
jgi:hypothetical protein